MKPITIIGGGLAGLTLGILLRRENVPAAVIEAGKYPRHRVCGEFISGRGRGIFHRLGLEEKISEKVEASTVSFHLKDRKPVRLRLQEPGLCVSRFVLDALLAEEFERAGGILKTGERANLDSNREGVVRATGRRRSENQTGHLFGLKAHALRASLSADLELHFGASDYVGLCGVGGDRVNVCGLFYSREPVRTLHERWKETLTSCVWSEALADATWDEESFSSVAGLMLNRQSSESQFAIGDAAAMIPPLTGNGMSMAFESAEVAFEPLLRFSRRQVSWEECLRIQATAWDLHFSARLRWAAFVQSLLFNTAGQQFLLICTRLFPRLPVFFFSRTR